jgi:hypothetical protein
MMYGIVGRATRELRWKVCVNFPFAASCMHELTEFSGEKHQFVAVSQILEHVFSMLFRPGSLTTWPVINHPQLLFGQEFAYQGFAKSSRVHSSA